MVQRLLMGNAAFAHAALEAGVNVVAGYPGTPSSEVVETVAARVADGSATGVHVEWSTNEKAALEVLAGASLCGARVLFTCKMVGLNVASDPLLSLNYIGVKGGCVLFVADDPGPISSQTEQDTRRFAAFAKLPVFDPATPEDGFDMMQRAFDLSEAYGTPVIVRPTTRICHASRFFDVAETTAARPLPAEGFVRSPRSVIFPKRAFEAHGEVNDRLERIQTDYQLDLQIEDSGTAPTRGIVTGGVSDAYTREALGMIADACAAQDIDMPAYRLATVGMPYPFPRKRALLFAEGLSQAIVFEELDHVIEDEMLRLAGANGLTLGVHGKIDGSTPARGENTVADIRDRLCAFLFTAGSAPVFPEIDPASVAAATEQPPVRPPVLCAGCPHRGSFHAVKRAVGKRDAVYCGDIGCYTLGNAAPLEAVDTCLCMGAGITMAQGFAVAQPDTVCLAFVGDSTFFASGMTGVANAVYNGHDITVCVLDNSTTAMTGGQPHPGTGRTLMGTTNTPIDIEGVLRSLGVECIVHADPFDANAATAAAAEAIDFAGPSAIIFEGPCMQMVRPEPSATVDVDRCTGCRKCITTIGCPAIVMAADGKRVAVDATLCTGCGLCVDLCSFGALSAPCRSAGRRPFSKAGE